MITVEECIVQSLYYRLVLITVRRGKQDVAAADTSTKAATVSSPNDTKDDCVDGVEAPVAFQTDNTGVDGAVTSLFETDLDMAAARHALSQGLGE